jgi:hypothetical protein
MSELETAFANFKKMDKKKLAELDDALAFVLKAKMPTSDGAVYRAMLADNPPDPASLKAVSAYYAYKGKLEHKPMDEKKRTLLRLNKVPEGEIANLDSREKWESDQLAFFAPLAEQVSRQAAQRPKSMEMPAEEVTAKAPKAKTAHRPAPKHTAAPKPEGAPAMAAPAPMAAPMPMPAPMSAPAPQGMLIAAPPAAVPQALPSLAMPPIAENKLPLGAQLGGAYV